jgi:hypothetical protein
MSYSFSNRDGTFFKEAGLDNILVASPSTGSTVAMPSNQLYYYVNNSGTLAALTVKLPPNPQPGDRFEICAKSAITSLTLQDSGGNAITGAPSSAAAGTASTLRYLGGAVAAWVKWR